MDLQVIQAAGVQTSPERVAAEKMENMYTREWKGMEGLRVTYELPGKVIVLRKICI